MSKQGVGEFTKSDAFQQEWAKAVAKAWADPKFRKRLEADPAAVLRKRGVPVPEGLQLKFTSDPNAPVGSTSPLEMAVAAGVACYSPAPGGGQPSTAGWSLCAGSPMTLGLCVSGAAPGGGQPSTPGGGQPSTTGWTLTVSSTMQYCIPAGGP